jgi:acetyltransferase-like isoleucine patch superfamily enzyme
MTHPIQRQGKLRWWIFQGAGLLRVPWRVISDSVLTVRALAAEWLWGIHAPLHLVSRIPDRQLPGLLRTLGAAVGAGVDLRAPLYIHNPQDRLHDLHIGAQTHIGKDCLLDLTGPVTIGAQVTLAMRVSLISHQDLYFSPLRHAVYPHAADPVTIEDGAYIGAGAIILKGVTVGRCAVVAAGAVVREDVAPYTVVGGVPASVIKTLDPAACESVAPGK